MTFSLFTVQMEHNAMAIEQYTLKITDRFSGPSQVQHHSYTNLGFLRFFVGFFFFKSIYGIIALEVKRGPHKLQVLSLGM